MRVKYPGPHDAVDVADLGTVERGVPVDVPTALGRQLIAQGWHPVAPVRTRKKKES